MSYNEEQSKTGDIEMIEKTATIGEVIEKLEFFKQFYGNDVPVVKLFNDRGGIGMKSVDTALDIGVTCNIEGKVFVGLYVD